jgi:CRP-like cAMP-binding protein
MQLSEQNLDFQHNGQGKKFTPLPNLKSYSFNQGQNLRHLFQQGLLWHIHSGYVWTFSLEEDGTIIPLGFWSTGDLVGDIFSTLDPYEIECITNVTVVEVPRTHEISSQIILSHLQQAQELIRIMHQPTVEEKLLRFLQMLAHRFGNQTNGSLLIEPYLTHEQIANSIGTSRITVTKRIGELKRSGKLHWSKKYRLLHRS